MKNVALIVKILTAIAAIVGAAYLVATYGEQVVAWAKKMLASCPCKCDAEDCANCACDLECPIDGMDLEEDLEAEEVPVAEEIDEDIPVAEEIDFE